MSERDEALWLTGWSGNAREASGGYGGINCAVHAIRGGMTAMCGFVVGECGGEVPASDIGCKRCQRAICRAAGMGRE